MSAAAKFRCNGSHIHRIGRGARHNADSFIRLHKQEQSIRIQQVPDLVGNTGDFLIHTGGYRGGNQDVLPLDSICGHCGKKLIINAPLFG